MTPGHDRGRAVGRGAVAQQEVCADREHGVRDAVVPLDPFGTRHVRTGVAMPRAAPEVGGVAPRRVRDDVTVVAEQRLDDLEDALGVEVVEGVVVEVVLGARDEEFERRRPVAGEGEVVVERAAAQRVGLGRTLVALTRGDAPVVELLEQRAEALHPSLGALGPDLLSPDFDADEVLRRLRDPSRRGFEVAAALLDQRALAGIGNVYKSEVLWIERVSPFAHVGGLDDETLARLVATAHRLLLANVAAIRGPERTTTTGDRGAPGPLYVYSRAGRPCRRCRTPIARTSQGVDLPRLTFWCPVCQPRGAR